MNDERISRADLHCHSAWSQVARPGARRALGLPECATPPEEVYELAKARGMDFVTITDHDAIDGALELAERHDDAFPSVELTVRFRGEPQAVHVLCWGVTEDDFGALRDAAHDVEAVAALLRERGIAAALAHPLVAVRAPLRPRQLQRLARLFGVWETRNGAVPAVRNAAGPGTGGSDDHAGIDVARTWTQTPRARTWREFLAHVRSGRAEARGEQGSAAKWAHAVLAIAARAGDADARAQLAAWLGAAELPAEPHDFLALLQAGDFSHAALERRARRLHARTGSRIAVAPYERAAAALEPAEVARAA